MASPSSPKRSSRHPEARKPRRPEAAVRRPKDLEPQILRRFAPQDDEKDPAPQNDVRANLLDFSLESLKAEFQKAGIEKYRARQVFDWIYKKGVYELGSMTNLSDTTKKKISGHFRIEVGGVRRENKSRDDSSVKLLVELEDKDLVETVYIPKGARRTVCVSTQVGCKFRCTFCASGQAGFFRNLSSSEILAQVLRARDLSDTGRISNLVFMGIGEPLDNYKNLLKAIRALNSPAFLGLGARKITISTCGVVPRIKELAGEGMQIELSISLHGATDEIRGKIMPVNRAWPVKELVEAAREYTAKTKREITFEYILAEGLNASLDDARDLVRLLKRVKCKINLIPLNPIREFPYTRPNRAAILAFEKYLNDNGIRTTVRFSSGTDINAACGQLRSVEIRGVDSDVIARPPKAATPSLRGGAHGADEAISQRKKNA